MKPRRVFVTLEIETNLMLAVLRKPHIWGCSDVTCLQASANVAAGIPRRQKALLYGSSMPQPKRRARRKA